MIQSLGSFVKHQASLIQRTTSIIPKKQFIHSTLRGVSEIGFEFQIAAEKMSSASSEAELTSKIMKQVQESFNEEELYQMILQSVYHYIRGDETVHFDDKPCQSVSNVKEI
jgi:hypothetical protein